MITYLLWFRRSLLAVSLGILPAAPLFAQHLDVPLHFDTEADARRAVNDYYEWLVGGVPGCIAYVSITKDTPSDWLSSGLFRPLCQFPPECRGDPSLEDCFGGETLCQELARRCRDRATAADRGRLIEGLSRLRTGDDPVESDWVNGQLVNLLLKNGQLDPAQDIADRCAGTLWWCQALRGHVRHRRAPGSGEAHLDSALANAPSDLVAWRRTGSDADERNLVCAWTDFTVLLSPSLRSAYEQLPCGDRAEFEARFWWLADPLWSQVGNARRSEHLSRHVQLRLDDDLVPRSPSVRDAIVRDGWADSWRAYVPPLRPQEDPVRMTTELRERHETYVRGGYSFVPDARTYAEPGGSPASDWAVGGEGEEKIERMVPGDTWYDLVRHQTALLRRGERLLVLATALLPVLVDDLAAVDAFLAVGRPADRAVEVTRASIDKGVVRGAAQVDEGAWVASLEIMGTGWRGRLRQGTPAPALDARFGVSDLILMTGEPRPDDDSILASMVPTTELGGRSSVGVYFEVYGADVGESLNISLSIERTDRSFFGRLGGFLGLGSSEAYAVDWTEAVESPAVSPRYVEIALDGFDEGQYEIRLSVSRDSGGPVAEAARRFSAG